MHTRDPSEGNTMTMRSDRANLTAYRELTQIQDFIDNEWGFSDEFDGPTFLWDPTVGTCSRHDDALRADTPVAPPDEAEQIIRKPMQWYFDGIAAIAPTAHRSIDGVDVPHADMPTFRIESQALAGVDAVVANATSSTHWLDGTRNLCRAIELTARFLSTCEDRNQEGLEYLGELLQATRIHLDAVARNADTADGAEALRMVTAVACNDDFRLNPAPMIELLSCCLSFAQYDDTRIHAYETLGTAVARMDEMASRHGEAVDDDARFRTMIDDEYAFELADLEGLAHDLYMSANTPAELNEQDAELHALYRFRQAVLLMRHDLMRMSGDGDRADALLRTHATTSPLGDAYAARLIHARRWSELLDFTSAMVDDDSAPFLVMFPDELVPYDWESLQEVALQALNDRPHLRDLYRERVLSSFDEDEMPALTNLRRVSTKREWREQVARIVEIYQHEATHAVRNRVYERMLVMQGMRDEALRYLDDFPDAWPDLAEIL